MHVPFLETIKQRHFTRRHVVLGGIGFVILLASILLVHTHYFGPVAPRALPAEEFIVAPDEDLDVVIRNLKEHGYIKSMTAFRIAYLSSGGVEEVREGGYMVSASMDTWRIAELLSRPPYLAWITFPPGWRKEEIADYLAKKLHWTPAQKQQFITVDTVQTPEESEGVYYGDTYLIPSDQDTAQVAARLRNRFKEVFAPYAAQTVEKNVTWTEALTMASLIEREASAEDRELVSGILWNRINDGMRLQADATLQYIRGTEEDWWPTPRPEDKQLDSPFNTYKYSGLPPRPIANPSLASIEAALNPADTNCLYYLHDSDGVIHCAASYEGHRANIDRYLR